MTSLHLSIDYTIKVFVNNMGEKDNIEDIKEEKENLNKLGVSETWSLLKDSSNKKKSPDEERPVFRGFK